MRSESRLPRPSMSLRQSRCNSQATANQFIICAPAALMRAQAACCTVSLKVPEASVTTNTSKPSARADRVGNPRAIGSLLETGGEDSRQLEELGQIGQCQHVVLEFVRRKVLDQGDQARLVVDQQDYRVILIQALVGR